VHKTRISSLDGLRGIAALAVVLYHYTFRYDALYSHHFSLEKYEILKLGYLGVDLFFIISGFVIFMSIEATDKFKTFVINRFSRLFPAYWFAVLFTFIVVIIFGLQDREVSLLVMIANLTMLNGFLGIPYVDGVYWSLMVELTFYAFISFFYFYLNKKFVLVNFLSLVWISFYFNYFKSIETSYDLINIVSFLLSMDYLHLFGAGIGFYLLSIGESKMLAWLLIVSSVIHTSMFETGAPLIVLFSFYFIFMIVIYGNSNILSLRIFTYLGSISYSLYLVHQNIGYIIINYAYDYSISPYYALALAVIASIFISHVITKYIEMEYNKKLKRKLHKWL
jgi:peptidoglycan/LPS O-acetylase OafA/YrhL